MAGETVITIVGNLVDDPELKFTPASHAVAKFRVASTPARSTARRTSGKTASPCSSPSPHGAASPRTSPDHSPAACASSSKEP